MHELEKDSPTFIRLHPIKSSFCTDLPIGDPVPWNQQGRKLSSRPKFNLDPLYHGGMYYPMEASSMFLDHVLKGVDLNEGDLILDLCAAPGGKSLILADHFPNNVMVSNEIDRKRSHVLKENAIRWGTEKQLVVNSDAKQLSLTGLKFALILIDAPCSGEGLFRKDPESRAEWTEERAAGCAVRQSQILEDVMPLLAPGGTIIYSTCTYNPAENMERIQQLVEGYALESKSIPLKDEWGVEEIKKDQLYGYQFWPHRLEGEGFFISLLSDQVASVQESGVAALRVKEKEVSLPNEFELQDKKVYALNGQLFAFSIDEWIIYQQLKGTVNVVKKGTYVGEYKGNDFIPSHDPSALCSTSSFPRKIDLNLDQAIEYLKGNALKIQSEKGVVLLKYKGLGIGFGKSNGDRINNLIPKHLRIF